MRETLASLRLVACARLRSLVACRLSLVACSLALATFARLSLARLSLASLETTEKSVIDRLSYDNNIYGSRTNGSRKQKKGEGERILRHIIIFFFSILNFLKFIPTTLLLRRLVQNCRKKIITLLDRQTDSES